MTPIPGLSERSNLIVDCIIKKYPQMGPFVLFGSRAKGNYRVGSDIDIVAKGDFHKNDLSNIKSDFEESLLPYFVDVVSYRRITNPDLKEHIDRVGILL